MRPLHVSPKVGESPSAIRALLLAGVDVSSSPVHHHLQSALEPLTTHFTMHYRGVVMVCLVIIQQVLALPNEATGIANEHGGDNLGVVRGHVLLVHHLVFEGLVTFGTVMRAPVHCVDVELLGMVVFVLRMYHAALTVPL